MPSYQRKYGKVEEVLSFILGCRVRIWIEHRKFYQVTFGVETPEAFERLLRRLNELSLIPRIK